MLNVLVGAVKSGVTVGNKIKSNILENVLPSRSLANVPASKPPTFSGIGVIKGTSGVYIPSPADTNGDKSIVISDPSEDSSINSNASFKVPPVNTALSIFKGIVISLASLCTKIKSVPS